ncbi:MAG: CheY-like chemotaxis protein/anti-sigma regulatory factor (Ser/Thr protein kinase) [Lentisphaeria bacterium]
MAVSNCSRERIYVQGDQAKLRQILINLLDNAVKFTDKGSVVLSLKQAPKNVFHFEVQDDGEGIEKEAQTTIFEPFQQAEAGFSKGGTCLGLTIASKHVALMAGELLLESQPSCGCRFYFSIPLVLASGPATLRNDRDLKVLHFADGNHAHVLVVDDVITNRIVLSAMLKNIGTTVEQANGGEEALDKLKNASAAQWPDLIFLDIQMPDFDGLETRAKIKQLYQERTPPCVAITALDQNLYMARDFVKCIAKPFRIESIYDCLKQYLDVTFEYSEATSTDRNTALTSSDFSEVQIPTALYLLIKEAAEDSEVERLETALNELEMLGPLAQALAASYREHLSQYDMDGLLEHLNKITRI